MDTKLIGIILMELTFMNTLWFSISYTKYTDLLYYTVIFIIILCTIFNDKIAVIFNNFHNYATR